MNLQAIFDKVVGHLRQQGCKAMQDTASGTAGAYRGQNGTKCAAGCLIPDALYRPAWENKLIRELVLNYGITQVLGMKPMKGSDGDRLLSLISDLQGVHDTRDPIDWEIGFRQVAATHLLSYPEMNP